MAENHEERKRKALNEREAALVMRRQAAEDQLNSTINAADREPLKKQIESFDKELEEIEAERNRSAAKSPDPNRRYLNFEEKIHLIDFSEVKDILGGFVHQAKEDGAAGLFLIQNSSALGGKWCLEIVRQELNLSTMDYKPHPIGFTKNDRLDEAAILGKLADRFNVPPVADNLDRYVGEIVKSICGSIYTNSAVFIEINNWDYFCGNDRVFNWFIEQFWARLTQSFRVHDKRRKAKLVVALVTSRPVPAHLLQAHCCDDANPIVEKLRLLPLRKWFREEIEDFLDSGVFSWGNGMTVAEMTDLVYDATQGGQPSLVYEALREHIFNES